MRQHQMTRTWGAFLAAGTAVIVMASVMAPGARAASAVPDISGPWQIEGDVRALKTIDGAAPPLLPAAQAQQKKNAVLLGKKGDPMDRCLPPGTSRMFTQSWPFNIVQGSTMYGVMFEWNHLTRVIYMNQPHFEGIGPEYFGQSVGHWEGGTLVVDTNSYNDTTWLDDAGLPHSDQLHTVEKISLKDGGRILEDRISFDDPQSFSKPWETLLRFSKKPGAIIKEDYCLGRTGQGVTKGG